MGKLIDINTLNKNNDYINDNINARLIDNASKNLLPLTLQSIKSLNTTGTWSDNVYTIYGVTFTINTNDVGYVTSIVFNRISGHDSNSYLFLINETDIVFTNDYYILNGIPNSSPDTYYVKYISPDWEHRNVYNNDEVMNIDVSRIRIDILTSCNANNVIFYPMVRRKQITDNTFEPYYKTNKQLDKNLTVVDTLLTDNACKNLSSPDDITNMYNISKTNNDGNVIISQIIQDTRDNMRLSIRTYSDNTNIQVLLETEITNNQTISLNFTKHNTFNRLRIGHNGTEDDANFYINVSNLIDEKIYTLSFRILNCIQQNGVYQWDNIMIRRAEISDNTFEPHYKTNKQLDTDLIGINTLLIDNACKNIAPAFDEIVNGVAQATSQKIYITNKIVTISLDIARIDSVPISNNNLWAIYKVSQYDINNNFISDIILSTTDGIIMLPSGQTRFSKTIEVDSSTEYIIINFSNYNDDTNYNTRKYNLQVEYGRVATPYKPYYKTNKQLDTNLTVANTLLIDNACKNLFDYDKWTGTGIYNGTAIYENYGITLTANGDDCYTFFGYDKTVNIPVESNKTYTLSWDININKTTASDLTTSLVVTFFNGAIEGQRIANANSKTLTFTVPENITFVTIRFGVQNNEDTIAYENIMLRRAEIIDDTFEPYYRSQKQLDKDLSNMIYRDENGSTVLTSYTINSSKDDAYIIIKPEGDSDNLSIIDGDEFTIHDWTNVDFDNINAINMRSKSLDITSETSFKLNIGWGGGTITTKGNTLLINSYSDRIDITSYDSESDDSFTKANEINIAYDGDPLEILSYSGGIDMYAYNGSSININANDELHLVGNSGIYMSTGNTSDMYISTNYVSIIGTTGIDFEGNDIRVKLSSTSNYVTLKQYIQGVMNGTY